MTQLQYQQISPCFELITKKYSVAFSPQSAPLQNVLLSPENTNKEASSFELKLKPVPILNDKPEPSYHRVELASRTNIPENKTILGKNIQNKYTKILHSRK